MNSIIASTLLYYPRTEISVKDIKISTKLLYSYILDRGFKNYISATPANYDINQAALNLGFQVIGKPLDRKVGDKAIVDLKERDSILKVLTLFYYGN